MKTFSIVVCCAALAAASCSFEAALPKFSGRAASPPELLSVQTNSASEVRLSFSEPVSVQKVVLDPPRSGIETDDGETVSIHFSNPYDVGERVTADIIVSNAEGNTLEAVLTFSAFNDRVPDFVISEIRTEMSKPRVEFIELKILNTRGNDTGNLAGVRLFAASNGTRFPIYEFPSVEVAQDDYVLLHLRSPDYIDCIDETDGDLTLSKPSASASLTNTQKNNIIADCPIDVCDLWVRSNTEKLRKSDAVYFIDQMDTVIDAVVFCDKAKESEKWGQNPNFLAAQEILQETESWMGDGIDGAVDSNGTSPTNTLNRNMQADTDRGGDGDTAEDWYKSGSSKATPGRPNTPPTQ